MSPVFTAIVLLLTGTMICQTTEAIQCYKCDFGDDNCLDPFKPGPTSTCTGNYCAKSKGVSGSVTVVSRYCLDISDGTGCAEVKVSGAKGYGCICDTNLCNTGSTISGDRLMVSLTVVTLVTLAIGRLQL